MQIDLSRESEGDKSSDSPLLVDEEVGGQCQQAEDQQEGPVQDPGGSQDRKPGCRVEGRAHDSCVIEIDKVEVEKGNPEE